MQFFNMKTSNFFLLVIFTSIFNKFPSKEAIHTQSLILGLTHSAKTIPTPKSTLTPAKKLSLLDVTEPLKEVRNGYTMSLNLGTPPQLIQVFLDTGSDLTWVPCGNLSFECIDCDEYRNNKLTSSFSPSKSSSSSRDSCLSPLCLDVHSSDNSFDPCTMAGCSLNTLMKSTCYRPCTSFAYTYGDGVVAGILTRDVLRVRGLDSFRDVPKFGFGCVSATYRMPTGIVGFGKGILSLPSQLGFLQKGFSHCFLPFRFTNYPNISSPLIVGDLAIYSKEYFQFTPMLKCPTYPNYYYIVLEAITVGNTVCPDNQVPLSLKEFDSLGNGGMIIDSGTTYTHLPSLYYQKLISVIQSVVNYPRANDVEGRSGFDLCYIVPCPTNDILTVDDLPLITLHFLNNVSLALPQGNSFYAMSAPNNMSVVKCLLFQSMEDDENGPAGIFGSFQQQNVEVVYDLEKERIGFQVADCAHSASTYGLQGIYN